MKGHWRFHSEDIELIHFFSVSFEKQYYREARIKALQAVYPDYVDELAHEVYSTQSNGLRFSKPFSAPPSPSSSRHTTPHGSQHGSDDEDSVDDELELKELGINNHH